MTQYNNLKRNLAKTVNDFFMRFMKIYQSIPPLYKPPLGAAQLHYAYAFENDFSLFLRERKSKTLTDMMNDPIEVKITMISSGKLKQKIETEKRKDQSSTSQNSYVRLETMMGTMDNFFENIST